MAYDETQRRISLDADSSIGIYTGVSGMPGSGVSLPVPTGLAISNEGTDGSTTYAYRVSALNAAGETLACAEVKTDSGNATLDDTNYNSLSWTAVTGAVSYNVYGRTAGAEEKLANVTTNSYDDKGADTPSGNLPTKDTSSTTAGMQYRFVKVTGSHQAGLSTNATNEVSVGVLQNKPQHEGDAATVAISGVTLITCGSGGLSAGDIVKSDSAGRGVAGTAGSDTPLAICIEDGTAGALAPVLLQTN